MISVPTTPRRSRTPLRSTTTPTSALIIHLPRGPPAPPHRTSDELRLAPAIDWIAAALPQQNPLAVEAFDGAAAALHVVGQAAQMIEVGSGPTVATVTSNGPAFVRWVTQRGSWEQLDVMASGDERALAALRRLHVY